MDTKRGCILNKYKKEILEHQLNFIKFAESLYSLSENQWRTQIEEGKWTIAEIMGHFKPWDEFVIKKRLPFLFSDVELPKGPDAEKVNSESSSISRKESKKETLTNFISIRKELYDHILQIPDELWQKQFHIGKSQLSLYEYFNGLAKHDRHHYKQIKNIIHA